MGCARFCPSDALGFGVCSGFGFGLNPKGRVQVGFIVRCESGQLTCLMCSLDPLACEVGSCLPVSA